MTIREQAKWLLGLLTPLAQQEGGRAFVASDPVDCIEQLRMKPGKASYAVLWVNELSREENGLEILGRLDRMFKVVVSRGRSLKLQPGESLTEGAAGGQPMFDLVEDARQTVLNGRLPDDALEPEELTPLYKGSGPFEISGITTDAVEIRVSLAAQIPVQYDGREET